MAVTTEPGTRAVPVRGPRGAPAARATTLTLGPWEDLRLLQVPFSLLLLLDVLLRVEGGVIDLHAQQDVACAGAALLALGVLALPRGRATSAALVFFCAADLALVGLSRLAPEDGGSGLLVMLPALWLGARLGRRGVLLTLGLVVVLVGVPGGLYNDLAGETLARTLPLPLVAGAAAYAVALSQALARREERRAAEHLRDLETAVVAIELETRRIRTLLDTAGVGLLLMDEASSIVLGNPLGHRFVGLGLPETGQPATEVGHVFRADGVTPMPHHERPSGRLAAGDEFDDLRVWLGADPATRRLLSVSGRQLSGPGERRAGGVIAIHDVTHRERDVRLRAGFLDSIAHELRTPLTSIETCLHLLAGVEGLPVDARDLLPVLERSTQRLGRLSAELIDQADHAYPALPLEPVETDVTAELSVLRRRMTPVAERAGVRLAADLAPDVGAVLDPARLRQAVAALLDNALDASTSGDTVLLRLEADADTVVVSVGDDGPGIDSSHHLAVLAPGRDGGTGRLAGLPLVQAVASAHGGRVDIDSRLGGGATFVLRIPRTPPAAREVSA